MKKRSAARSLAATGVLALLGSVAAGAEYALIYNGPVAAEDCPEAAAAVARETGLSVRFVSDLNKLPGLLKRAEVFIIGGTDDDLDPLIADFTPAAKQAVQEYVRRGGRYLGICGGAYLAGTGYRENGRYVPLLDLIPAEPHEFEAGNYAEQILPIRWMGATYPMYFQGGPAFELTAPARVRIIAKYADGQVAALVSPYGRGKVAVIGPHPEADSSWADHLPRAEHWTSTRHLLVQLLRQMLAPVPVPAGGGRTNIAPDHPGAAR
jgi:glutamine amidotransferase-like uncharacterized protein